MKSGDESVGLVSNANRDALRRDVSVAFHELEEFDVTESALVGHEPSFYYQKPRNMATYVGGQLLHLRHIPSVTNMERNSQVDALNLEDNIAGPDQKWPEEVQNMRLQVGIIDVAAKMLGLSAKRNK